MQRENRQTHDTMLPTAHLYGLPPYSTIESGKVKGRSDQPRDSSVILRACESFNETV